MSALSAARITKEIVGARRAYPVLANAVIYQGSIVVVDSSGYAKAGVTGTGLIAVGRACANSSLKGTSNSKGSGVWDATGVSSAGFYVEVEEGTFAFGNSGGGDAINFDDVGKPCYVVDDQTVALTNNSDTMSPAGRVDWDGPSSTLYVQMGADIAREISESQVISTGQAYTQTYSTVNRTVAAPTATAPVTLTDSTGLSGSHDDTLAATTVPTTLTDSTGQSGTHDDTLAATTVPAALTVSDGVGTNDGTIGAITADASVIAAVQELAAKIGAILTLLGVMVQNASDTAQKVIEHNALLAVIAQNVSDVGQKVIEHNTQITSLIADDLDNRQTVGAVIDDLQTAGIVS